MLNYLLPFSISIKNISINILKLLMGLYSLSFILSYIINKIEKINIIALLYVYYYINRYLRLYLYT